MSVYENTKHTDSNYSKTDQWRAALKKALYLTQIYLLLNYKQGQQNQKKQYNWVCDLLTNYLQPHSKSLHESHPIIQPFFSASLPKFTCQGQTLTCQAHWDSINSSPSNQLGIPQHQIPMLKIQAYQHH